VLHYLQRFILIIIYLTCQETWNLTDMVNDWLKLCLLHWEAWSVSSGSTVFEFLLKLNLCEYFSNYCPQPVGSLNEAIELTSLAIWKKCISVSIVTCYAVRKLHIKCGCVVGNKKDNSSFVFEGCIGRYRSWKNTFYLKRNLLTRLNCCWLNPTE